MTDEDFMQIALQQAKKAYAKDEVPVGAVIVDPDSGKIVARAYNKTEHGNSPTSHAEIEAINKACKKLNSKRLWNLDLYVTLEPCTMCAAAISFARIRRLIFGAIDTKGGAVVSGVQFFNQPTCHHKPQLTYGILAEPSSQILKDFFKNKRFLDRK